MHYSHAGTLSLAATMCVRAPPGQGRASCFHKRSKGSSASFQCLRMTVAREPWLILLNS